LVDIQEIKMTKKIIMVMIIALIALVSFTIAPASAIAFNASPDALGDPLSDGGNLSVGYTFPLLDGNTFCVEVGQGYAINDNNFINIQSPDTSHYGDPVMVQIWQGTTTPDVPVPSGADGWWIYEGSVCMPSGSVWLNRVYTIGPMPVYNLTYNLTVIVGVVGGGNYSVSDALVEIHLHDAYDTIISGDTDINGTIVFEGVDITAAPECRIFATGYQYWGEFFAPTGDTTIIANLIWMTTPTTGPTIVPGYIRTEIATIDIYGARIYGTTINILDVEAGVWKNSTNDADGLLYVDTLPYHTLNVYGSYTLIADQYLDAELIGISTGYDGGIRFYLVLYPADIDPGLGNVNLYVTVLDNNGLVPIPTALVKIGIPGNPTLSGYTSSSGVQRFVVPNQTVLHITAEKSGYQTGGTIINSGTGVTADAIIALDRITVTPTTTGYIPTGGITPIVTFDSRNSNQKDTDMMEIIRNAGPDLINLAIAATIIGLLGLMMKGLK
jgi:hypothetical protein